MNLQTYEDVPCKQNICRNPSIRERLDDQKTSLEAQLARVNEAIAALEAAPETARVLELISKV